MPEILSEEKLLDGQLVVEKATLSENGETFERLRVVRQNASAVLLYDAETDKVVLTQQYRYPVAAQSPDPLLEIVAGKIDAGEEPSDAAIREVEEETGYKVQPDKLRLLTSCFVSPGYSTEQFYVFVAEVTARDRVSDGGGLEEEHEKIELVELGRETFLADVKNGAIRDAKTIIAALLYFS
jgi:nudix-type nucleoside diphosphatase (YffH/AdpP family)